MRRRRQHGGRGKKSVGGIYLLVGIVAMVTGYLCVDIGLRPTVQTFCQSWAQTYGTEVLNTALTQELATREITYGDLVKVTTNQEGNVTSIQTDMAGINRIATSITGQVVDRVAAIGEQEVLIPLGTILGSHFLSGRGPSVGLIMLPAASAVSDVYNQFDSAGINQTRHQIMLRVTVSITAVMPGYTTQTQVTSGVCLAETIIVGVVPEAFTKVETEQDSMEGIVADYGNDENRLSK